MIGYVLCKQVLCFADKFWATTNKECHTVSSAMLCTNTKLRVVDRVGREKEGVGEEKMKTIGWVERDQRGLGEKKPQAAKSVR
ncbi:hypothetical protein ACLOJK_005315 [Asimina triloba]